MKTIQPLESRTTPFQEGEDDEDIPAMDTTPTIINGPITRSHAMQIHNQGNANLSLSFDLENMVVPSPPLLLVELRCDIEEGQTHFSLCKTMFYGKGTKLGSHEECLLKKHCSDSDETMFCMSLHIPTCEGFPEHQFAAEGNIVRL